MKAQGGFTLLELLVSMTLLAMLFVLLFGGLRFGMRAWERGTGTADAVDQVRIAQDLLRREIERSCPRRLATARPQDIPRVDFTGEATELAFLAPAPGAAGGAPCAATSLSATADGKLMQLVLEINRSGTALLHGVQGIALSYRAGDGVWRNDWNGETTLPTLVRLRVTFPKGDNRVWPELFIAPRISAEADCTYDPATKSCRGG